MHAIPDLLYKAAQEARGHAYAPYSRFPVAAVLRTPTGRLFTGVNVENSVYGLTLCAERVALVKAISEGEQTFEALGLLSPTHYFITPCGACRQVLSEFAPDLSVYLFTSEGKMRETSLSALLPEAFSRRDLR